MKNSEAGRYVNALKPFKANNLYATYVNNTYVVFSYGEHFPIYAYHQGTWYANEDRRSQSTKRHQTYAKPDAPLTYLSTAELKALCGI